VIAGPSKKPSRKNDVLKKKDKGKLSYRNKKGKVKRKKRRR